MQPEKSEEKQKIENKKNSAQLFITKKLYREDLKIAIFQNRTKTVKNCNELKINAKNAIMFYIFHKQIHSINLNQTKGTAILLFFGDAP